MNGHFSRPTTSAKSISWVSTIALGEKNLAPSKVGQTENFQTCLMDHIENYLLVRNFLKHAGFHLFCPLQSFWAKKKFYYRELLVSEKFLNNTGFPLWFYNLRRVSAESPVYFGRKV